MIGFGDITRIGFRIIAQREEIMKTWDDIAPLIKQGMQTYGKARELVDLIAPGIVDQMESKVATDPLASGDDGSFSAIWLQQSLNDLLGTKLVVDGDVGEESRQAIRKFQLQEGLPVDGWAGAGTCAQVLKRLEEKKAA